MRIALLTLVIFMAGCVSQSQPGNRYNDNFDRQEAAKTRISLGLTYLKNGNYSQAKSNLDKALEFAPRMADAHYSLAYYYQLVGENQRAEDAYQNAMDLAPRNADIANSYGAFLCQSGRYDDAKSYFLKAVNSQRYSNSAETYENMALCAQGQGETDDAIEYLNTALNYQPTRAKSLFLLTELYVSLAQWDDAKASLKKLEKVGRVSPESLWLAVQIAQGQGDLETSKGYGDMLMTMYPTSSQAKAYQQQKLTMPAPVVSRKAKNRVIVVDAEPEAGERAQDTQNGMDNDSMSDAVTNSQNAEAADTASASAETADDPSAATQNADESQPQSITQNQQNSSVEAVPEQNGEAGDRARFHIVQKKENLYRISLRYNVKMDTLKEWNSLDDSGAIFARMKLWLIPPEQQEEE
ncbi:type IV pilus biogenesis/stability protein PilW [Alteromonas sp. H39]|uniref:type IV pilus biogenesis/stability protein PilW n=1 Tax=Alteromonas sp. H39 TaxID=3389876 RepID=UPI0039DFE9F5